MIQGRFETYLDKLRQDHPESFFEKIGSIPHNWRIWKEIDARKEIAGRKPV